MANINCFVGTVYGGAEALCEQLKSIAESKGHGFELYNPGSLTDFVSSDAILIVTSTTGQGDIPFELESLYLALESEMPLITKIPFAVIAMGDSSYGETYCGAGKKFRDLLHELQGNEVVEMLMVDASEHFDPLPVATPWFDLLLDKLG